MQQKTKILYITIDMKRENFFINVKINTWILILNKQKKRSISKKEIKKIKNSIINQILQRKDIWNINITRLFLKFINEQKCYWML